LQQLHRDEHQHGIVVPDQLLHRVTPRGSWIGFNRSHCAVSMPWSDGAFSPRKRTIRPGFQDWPRRRHLSQASRPTSSGQWRSVEKRFASASVQKRLQKIHFRSGPIQSWVHSIANAFLVLNHRVSRLQFRCRHRRSHLLGRMRTRAPARSASC
jgi:hypothetical protein